MRGSSIQWYRDQANKKLSVGAFPYQAIMDLCDEVERMRSIPVEKDSQVEYYRGIAENEGGNEQLSNFASKAIVTLCGKIDRLNRVLAVTTDPQYVDSVCSEQGQAELVKLHAELVAWEVRYRHSVDASMQFLKLIRRLEALATTEQPSYRKSAGPLPAGDIPASARDQMLEIKTDLYATMRALGVWYEATDGSRFKEEKAADAFTLLQARFQTILDQLQMVPTVDRGMASISPAQQAKVTEFMSNLGLEVTTAMVTSVQAEAAGNRGTAADAQRWAKELASNYNTALNLLKTLGLA